MPYNFQVIDDFFWNITWKRQKKVQQILEQDSFFQKLLKPEKAPLFYAIIYVREKDINSLIDQEGFNINAPLFHLNGTDFFDFTPIQFLCSIFPSFAGLPFGNKSQFKRIFKKFLEKGADINIGANTLMGTPFFIASSLFGDTPLFEEILNEPTTNINLGRNIDGCTPLYLLMCKFRDDWQNIYVKRLIKLLEREDLDVNKPNIYGITPIFISIRYLSHYNIDIFKSFLKEFKKKGVLTNIVSNLYGNLLFFCLSHGCETKYETYKYFTKKPPIQYLLENIPININEVRPFDGCSPLYLACGNYDCELTTVKFLIENGADMYSEAIRGGKSVLDYALENAFPNKAINKYIVSMGARNWGSAENKRKLLVNTGASNYSKSVVGNIFSNAKPEEQPEGTLPALWKFNEACVGNFYELLSDKVLVRPDITISEYESELVDGILPPFKLINTIIPQDNQNTINTNIAEGNLPPIRTEANKPASFFNIEMASNTEFSNAALTDDNTLLFKIGSSYFTYPKSQIQSQYDDRSAILYSCKYEDGSLFLTDDNIEKDTPYFYLRGNGNYMIPLPIIKKVLKSENKMYEIIDTGDKKHFTASYSVVQTSPGINQKGREVSFVGAFKCRNGSNQSVYTLQPFKFTNTSNTTGEGSSAARAGRGGRRKTTKARKQKNKRKQTKRR